MSKKKICNCLQSEYIRRYILSEGQEEGIKVIELNNGYIRLLLNESKGLDIMQLWHKGTNISFVSKNGFTKRELPYLERFEGGMLYTCGLDNIGRQSGFEMHGSYHNTPAKIISIDRNDIFLKVVAEMQISSLFGRFFVLTRTVTIYNGKDGSVEITDKLENRGTKSEKYCLLYHINLGYPMLDEGVEIIGDFGEIIPRSQHAEQTQSQRNIFQKPTDNQEESCYALENLGENISVVNNTLCKKFSLSYSKETLPYLVQWNSSASGDYALGLEPATSLMGNDLKYSVLDAGKEIVFNINMKINEI